MNIPKIQLPAASPHPELMYGRLDARLPLAVSISIDPSTGIVSVFGDGSDDSAWVTALSASQIEVSGTGALSQAFSISFVQRVDFFGYNGNDSFENLTSVASRAWGHAGNDTLRGGSANDVLNGGLGNDSIYGNDGDDTLLGAENDDSLFGGNGMDQLLGYTGNDLCDGGAGNDGVYGQGGNDQVFGGTGNDSVRGNSGSDSIFGGDGQDYMMGDTEVDSLYGEAGDDQLFGWSGNDWLEGGTGADSLYAQDGDDQLFGGDGDDLLRGGNGQDRLWGGEHQDRLYGEGGQDLLRGDGGIDLLRGGDDMDSLIGGESASPDTLYGDAGADRFLTQSLDQVVDPTAEDATLRFVNVSSDWTDRELEVIDVGLARLCAETNNTRLLRDSLDPRDLGFYKYSDLNGAAGINWLQTSGQQQWNPLTQQWEWVYTYQREIRILDWDESSSWYNDQYALVAIHEIGHSWDSELELGTISPQVGQLWNQFLAASGWTQVNPNDTVNYQLSLNGQWWYLKTAAFAENYGRTNPNEDCATIWEYAFDPQADPNLASGLQPKLAVLDAFFAAIRS